MLGADHFMKLRIITVAVALMGVADSVFAVPLLPGDGIFAVGEADPTGGSTLFSTNVSWGIPGEFLGTLISSVITNDPSNPFPGGLTFTYQFTVSTNGIRSATALLVYDFGSSLTDVSYLPNSGDKPFAIFRSGESSYQDDEIEFNFFNPFVPPGTNSALLVIQTDSSHWSFNIASMIASSALPNILIVAPGPPEILTSVNGNTLNLSWPPIVNWRLQVQTNDLSTGIGTNWVYLTDGSVTSAGITIDPNVPAVFFRLAFP